MNDDLYKGGRNHKAPYSTSHVRMPLELLAPVQAIIDVYKRCHKLGADSCRNQLIAALKEFPDNFLDVTGSIDSFGKPVAGRAYQDLSEQLAEAKAEIQRLQTTLHLHEQSRKEIKGVLEGACKLRANAGGAIKKEIKAIVSIL